MAKLSKSETIKLIIAELEKGTPSGEIFGLIRKKSEIVRSTYQLYLIEANKEHSANQQRIKEALAKVNEEAAVKARKKAIMTSEERKEYLTKIITGQVKIPYKEVKWNPKTLKFQTIKFVELANPQARISAIAELNKMDGDYAPAKLELKNTLTPEDLKKTAVTFE